MLWHIWYWDVVNKQILKWTLKLKWTLLPIQTFWEMRFTMDNKQKFMEIYDGHNIKYIFSLRLRRRKWIIFRFITIRHGRTAINGIILWYWNILYCKYIMEKMEFWWYLAMEFNNYWVIWLRQCWSNVTEEPFIWNITNYKLLNNIKGATNGDKFYSELFQIY